MLAGGKATFSFILYRTRPVVASIMIADFTSRLIPAVAASPRFAGAMAKRNSKTKLRMDAISRLFPFNQNSPLSVYTSQNLLYHSFFQEQTKNLENEVNQRAIKKRLSFSRKRLRNRIVWRLFRDLNVMRMTFGQSRSRNPNKFSIFLKFFYRSSSAITHARSQSANQLI